MEQTLEGVMHRLVNRDVVTTDPDKAYKCCGAERDKDGFCRHREYHPIYVFMPTRVAPKPCINCGRMPRSDGLVICENCKDY